MPPLTKILTGSMIAGAALAVASRQTAEPNKEKLERAKARESGFYWVKISTEWTIGQWDQLASEWSSILGYRVAALQDEWIEEVDEHPITRPLYSFT
jgi:hypothetical protein